MFEELAGGAADLLASLEAKLPILSDTDQGFVIGCRHHLDAGAPLTAQNVQELKRIAGTVTQATHNTLGVTEKPISIPAMLQTLGKNLRMLQPNELDFLKQTAIKVKAGQPLGAEEIERVVEIYTSKGF